MLKVLFNGEKAGKITEGNEGRYSCCTMWSLGSGSGNHEDTLMAGAEALAPCCTLEGLRAVWVEAD